MTAFLLLSILYAVSIPPSLSSPGWTQEESTSNPRPSTSNPRPPPYKSCDKAYIKTFDTTSCIKTTGDTGDVWYRHQENCYTFVHEYSLEWKEAFADCKKKGAHLASIHDYGEEMFLWSVILEAKGGKMPKTQYWIDGKRLSPPEKVNWIWTDGTTFCHRWFCPGDPPGNHDNDCLNIGGCVTDGLMQNKQGNCMAWMNDKQCTEKMPFICKRNIKGCAMQPCKQ